MSEFEPIADFENTFFPEEIRRRLEIEMTRSRELENKVVQMQEIDSTRRKIIATLKQKIRMTESDYEAAKQDAEKLMEVITEILVAPTSQALMLFKMRAQEVSGILDAFAVPLENGFDIVIIVEDISDEILDGIADIQYEMYRVFQNIDLDFLMIPKGDRNYDSIIPSNAHRIVLEP